MRNTAAASAGRGRGEVAGGLVGLFALVFHVCLLSKQSKRIEWRQAMQWGARLLRIPKSGKLSKLDQFRIAIFSHPSLNQLAPEKCKEAILRSVEILFISRCS